MKTCSGKTIEMLVENPKMSVMGFKRLIAEKECIPPQHQRLIFVAEELDNGKTLEEVVSDKLQKEKEETKDAELGAGEVELTFHLIASSPQAPSSSSSSSSSSTSTSSPPSLINITNNTEITGKRKRTADEATSSPVKASPSRKLSKKCAFAGCSKRSVVIIGDCKFCLEKFCSSHRLVEDHLCSATASCKQASFDKNASKLLREKCVAQKLRQY